MMTMMMMMIFASWFTVISERDNNREGKKPSRKDETRGDLTRVNPRIAEKARQRGKHHTHTTHHKKLSVSQNRRRSLPIVLHSTRHHAQTR